MKKYPVFPAIITLALLFSTTAFAQDGDSPIWRPEPGTSWQWQLKDALNTSWDVTMYDIDLFDTPPTAIDALHRDGRAVICYFSAGSHEDWRPDAGEFPDAVLGKPMEGWKGERWLDIRRIDLLEPVILARLDLAVKKGCDGVEPDNVDGFTNDTGFDLSYGDQLAYNRWMARQAHQRGLSIGLKNDLEQVDDLVGDFDWALNESCFQFEECDRLLPFIAARKAVFGVEYEGNPQEYCPRAVEMGFSWLTKTLDLGDEPPGTCGGNSTASYSLRVAQPTVSGSVAAQQSPLAACADILANYTPTENTNRYLTPTDLPLPPVRDAWRDPVFGSCIVRVTDRQQDFDRPLPGLKNEYARVQAFNADETFLMIRSVDGSWFLYNAQTLNPIREIAFGIDEPRWDAQNPYRFTFSVWFDALPQLMAAELTPVQGGFDVTASVVHDIAGELPPEWNGTAVWRRWEGSPSYDGRYDAFMVEDKDFIARGLITYDWLDGRIIGRYTIPHSELNEPDNVSISPLGDYVLAQFEFCERGMVGTYEAPCGAMIYTRDLSAGWGLLRIAGHGDMAVDASGREVLVYQDVDNDWISMVDLETSAVTPLLPLDFSTGIFGLHISGRASERAGWAAVSVQPEAPTLDFNNPFWMVGTVFAVELKANPRVIQIAHHHSIRSDAESDYFAEPQVTVNRDFTRLLFASNWGVYGNGEVEMYMIVLPDNWFAPPVAR